MFLNICKRFGIPTKNAYFCSRFADRPRGRRASNQNTIITGLGRGFGNALNPILHLTEMKTYFCLAGALLLLLSCGNGKSREEADTYETLKVTTQDETLELTYSATVKGRQNVEIRPQVSGTITEICINEGAE